MARGPSPFAEPSRCRRYRYAELHVVPEISPGLTSPLEESCDSPNCIKRLRGNVGSAGTDSDVAADSPVGTGGAAAFVGAPSTTPPCPGNPAGRRSASTSPRARACSGNRWSTTEHPLPGDWPGCRVWPRPASEPGRAGSAARLVSVVVMVTARSPHCRDLPFVVLPSCGRLSASPEIRLRQ
jgi:hypothetical protein